MKKVDLILKIHNLKTAFISDEFLKDMEIDVFSKVLLENEYNQFINIISNPLTNIDQIIERQNIIKDFMRHPHLITRIINLCEEANQNKLPQYRLALGAIPPKKRLNDYFEVLKKNFDVYHSFANLFLENEYESKSLKYLAEQFSNGRKVKEIESILEKVVGYINNDSISLLIEYGNAYKLTKASLFSQGPNLVHTKKTLLGKKDYLVGRDYGYDFIAKLQVDEYIQGAINNVTSMIHQLNSHIINFCNDLNIQVSFYNSVIKIINRYKDMGISLTFPTFNYNAQIYCTDIKDATLLFKRNKNDVIGNEFEASNDYMYLISGVNQGGKTTFLKSIGTSIFLAQNGLPICAKTADLPIITNFITHFPKEEDIDLNSGKLEEELLRLKKYLYRIDSKTLLLLNESFATTSEEEGSEIANDILRAISSKKPLVLFVTHNYHLLKNMGKYETNLHNNIKFKSLVTIKMDDPTMRSYKIIEGDPQEEIETIEFLKSRYMNG